MVEKLQLQVEILFLDTSTKRSSNYAPFDKVSKSGDSGRSGGILDTLAISTAVYSRKNYEIDDNPSCNDEHQRDTETNIRHSLGWNILIFRNVESVCRK
jgi:hypothetical protein